jgi:hypothetical protein
MMMASYGSASCIQVKTGFLADLGAGNFATDLAVEDGLQAGGMEGACPAVVSEHIKAVHSPRRPRIPQRRTPQQQLPCAAEAHIPGHPPAHCTTAELTICLGIKP